MMVIHVNEFNVVDEACFVVGMVAQVIEACASLVLGILVMRGQTPQIHQ